jgi:uncharacterized protein YndB with AHSA1/START domain
MATGTVKFHRVLRANPERVYRAFLDADAMAKWLPPYGFTCKVHHFEGKVGGTFKMSFTNFTTNKGHSFGGKYHELVPNEKIRYTDKFDDPNLPGEMQVTVTLRKVSCGTEMNVVQEGIPEAIPTEMCYLGWQESLAQLAHLVEPEIPGKQLWGQSRLFRCRRPRGGSRKSTLTPLNFSCGDSVPRSLRSAAAARARAFPSAARQRLRTHSGPCGS